jgi:ABC-type multidrug transport system fused ATPase/permease subunit
MNRELKKIISSFIRKQWLLFIGSFLLVLLVSYVNVLVPLSIGKFLDSHFQQHSAKSQLVDLFTFGVSAKIDFTILFFVLVALRILLGILSDFIATYVAERFVCEVKRVLFESQLRMRMSRFERFHMTTHLQKYSGEMVFIQRWISKGLIQGTGDALFICGVLGVLMFISWKLMVLILLTFGMATLLITLISTYLKSVLTKKNADRHSLHKYVSEQLNRLRMIKIMQTEPGSMKGFDGLLNTGLRSNVRYALVNSILKGFSPLAFYCILFLALIYLGQSDLSAELILAVILLLLYMQGALKRVLRIPAIWQQAKVAMNSIDRIYQSPRERRSENAALDENIVLFSLEQFTIIGQHHGLFEPIHITLKKGEEAVFIVKDTPIKRKLVDLFSGFGGNYQGNCSLNQTEFSVLTSNQIRSVFHLVNKDWMVYYHDLVLRKSNDEGSENSISDLSLKSDTEKLLLAIRFYKEKKKQIIVIDLTDVNDDVKVLYSIKDLISDFSNEIIVIYLISSDVNDQNIKSLCLKN